MSDVIVTTFSASIDENNSTVTLFTASDVILQKHVQPLSDQVSTLIDTWDPVQGILRLRKDSSILPTIQPGDIVVGAQYRIAPFKVSSITEVNNLWVLQGQLALPKDVFKQAKISNWQRVTLNLDGSVQTVNAAGQVTRADNCDLNVNKSISFPVINVPRTTYNLAVPTSIKALRPTISLELGVTANAEASLCGVIPIPGPDDIVFREDCNLWGICEIRLQAGIQDLSASAYLNLNGSLEWGLSGRFPNQPLTFLNNINLLVGTAGPVSFWIKFDVLGSMLIDAGAGVQVQGRVGLAYQGGRTLVTLKYQDEGESGKWDVEKDFQAGTFNRILDGDLDVYGFLQVGLNPEISPTIWASALIPVNGVDLFVLPKVGLNFYLRGELYPEPDEDCCHHSGSAGWEHFTHGSTCQL